MPDSYDAVIIGAGIAGLGVGAILSKEAGFKVLVVDRFPKIGGRLMSYEGVPEKGWRVEIGLHMIELGEKSTANELNARVGKRVEWAPFSETVDFWNGERFVSVSELIPMTRQDKEGFKSLLARIAALTDAELEAWDNRSLGEWLASYVPQSSLRDLFSILGMIMTTIPSPAEMAAGEVLYIARGNLTKTRRVLQASYPLDGMEALTRGLAEVIRDHGGEIRLGCEVDEVVFDGDKAVGVRVPAKEHPYEEEFRIVQTDLIRADRVVCAIPVYKLGRVVDLSAPAGPLPAWWVKRITDIQHEVTGLVGYVIGLTEPVVDPSKRCFLSALKTPRTGLPFQGFPASNFSPRVAPPGKQILHTDVVCEHSHASDRFRRKRLLALLWDDLREMFPGIEKKVEWMLPYYVDGCDGLARKPCLVGRYKPGLKAPGVSNLYFAGDTYYGRGLATNGAALSAMHCADLIMSS
jgi:phytoene dehydrogenase-like protein